MRHLVHDVAAAIAFYCDRLGFEAPMHPAPNFALMLGDGLRLLRSAPSAQAGSGQVRGDGTTP
ncbi:MAG TPA: hypothetical protein VNF24_05585 [Candidatus Acidoferrales bacterium]|nr:hypothetical protein [Candidatus Acidoferrales bacterium]